MSPPRPPLLTSAFARILALQACCSVALTSFVLLPKFLATELGAAPAAIGGVMASFSLANVCFVPLVGIGVDRFGRRSLIFVGCGLMLGAALGFLAVREIGPVLYALRAMQGVGFACVYISASALVVDHAPQERLSQALALMGAMMHAMAAVVPWLVERTSERFGWDPVFAAAGAAALLGGVLATTLRSGGDAHAHPDPREADAPAPGAGGAGPGLLGILSRGSLRRSALVIGLAGAAVATMTTFVQPYALERGIARVAGFFVAFSATAMTVRVVFGGYLDRANRQRLCALALVGYVLALLGTGGLTETRLVLLGTLFGLAHGLFMPSFNAMNLQGVAPAERGRVVSMLSGSFNLGLGLGTFLLGQVAAQAGYFACFAVAAAGAGAAALLLLAVPDPGRWSAAGPARAVLSETPAGSRAR